MLDGLREKNIVSIMDCKTEEETINFCERWDFEPWDILNLLDFYEISFKMKEIDLSDTCFSVIIETENFIFRFHNQQFIELTKKYNVADKLMADYNLPINAFDIKQWIIS